MITTIKPMTHNDLENPISEFIAWNDKEMTVRQWIRMIDEKIYGKPCISDECIDNLPDSELTGFVMHLTEVYKEED